MREIGKSDGIAPERSTPGIFAGTQIGAIDGPACRLMIVSDIRFLREGLAEVLTRDDAFAVVGVAAGLDEALEISAARQPQIIVIDAALPEGFAAARSLRGVNPHAPIVAIALAETETDVIAWAEAGISGYVPRTAGLAELVEFLRNIVRGEQICSSRIAASLLRWISTTSRTGARPRGRMPSLTAREEQVVRLICTGLSNKEISRRLNIGLATTKSHVHNLLAKLELERRAQVVRWSRDNGGAFRDEP